MLICQGRSERHLSLFGVRCNIGTDGIFIPTMLSLAFKSTWLYVAIGTVIYLFLHPGCNNFSLPAILSVSIIGYMLVLLAGVIVDIGVMMVSLLGSLSNYNPRRNIDVFIYAGLVVFLVQIGWDVFSTYTIFSPPVISEQLTNCSSYSTALQIYQGVILSHWGLLVFLFLLYLVLMDPLGCCYLPSRIKDLQEEMSELEKAQNASGGHLMRLGLHGNSIGCIDWLLRCLRCRRRGISTSGKKALNDFVSALGIVFEGMNYTYLDLWSGLRLAALFQKNMREKEKDPVDLIVKKTVDVLKNDEDYVVPDGPKKVEKSELKMHIVDLKYYLDYAMAAYGWPIHIYLNPCTGPVSLCVKARCNCCCARCQKPQFEGNECFPNQAAIKAMTGVEDEDIVTASFVNAVHIVPFYVVKAERGGQKQVIIAIRGTLSIKDALTDVSTSLFQLEEDLLGVHPSYVHRGFYQAALGVYEYIMDNEEFVDLVTNKNYRVVVTGHSLGAAVSSVLAVLLKHKHPEWTGDLKAFNFATPAVFNYPLAKKTDDFIITVVSGYDVVPRATIRGLGHLVLSVADMIENSKHKKQSVLCCTGCFGWEPKVDTDIVEERLAAALQELKVPKTESEDDTDGVDETDQSALTIMPTGQGERGLGKQVLKQLTRLAFRDEIITLVEGKEEEREPMTFNPGRILHLEVESVDHMKRCFSCGLKEVNKVKASWKAREELSGIQVHESMFLDHGPTRTIDFIHTLYNQLQETED